VTRGLLILIYAVYVLNPKRIDRVNRCAYRALQNGDMWRQPGRDGDSKAWVQSTA